MFNEEFVAGMACLGAGIAMIAGLGPGIGQGIACLLYTSEPVSAESSGNPAGKSSIGQ